MQEKDLLIAESVQKDPTIQKAKREILAALSNYRQKITHIRPPLTTHTHSYEEALTHLAQIRGLPLWYPYLGSGIGNGALVELADGSIKYDFISGIGVHWGHSHPKIIEACLEGACQDIAMQGNLQQNTISLELSQLLTQASGLPHCIITSSGAMAIENGLKLILQKKFPAHRILAFERCFSGRTLALSSITDKPDFRQGLPQTLFVDYIPFFDGSEPEKSCKNAMESLKKILRRFPKQHACMCFELIQGEAGYYPGSSEFFKSLIAILKDAKIAVLIDEVQTFGRTENLFAFQYFGLEKEADVVTVGKLSHVCATLYREEFLPLPGLISQTFTSSTAAFYAGRAIINSLMTDGYLGKNGKNVLVHRQFTAHLQSLSKKYPELIKGPFGCGTMLAFTFSNGAKDKTLQFAQSLFQAGVIGFIAGAEPTRVRFLIPAGGVTHADIDEAAKIIEQVLQKINAYP